MSLKLAYSGNGEVLRNQSERIVCECGCNEFEAPHIVAAFYDKLKPGLLAIAPLQAFRCLQCFQYLKWDAEAKTWTTNRLHYDPPSTLIPV